MNLQRLLHLITCRDCFAVMATLAFFLVACNTRPNDLPSAETMAIERYPGPADWGRGALTSLSDIPENAGVWDLRQYDVSTLDFSEHLHILMNADFDTTTVWPRSEGLPNEFSWEQRLEQGKNPGLGVRALHERGITGAGVVIAIVDQPLLIEHSEYAGRLLSYREFGIDTAVSSQMHGPAVTSIAIGETVGVAPEARAHYAAAFAGYRVDGEYIRDYTAKAEAIRYLLDMNTRLPPSEQFRVISISAGWVGGPPGYDEVVAAVAEARAAGVLVVYSGMSRFSETGFGVEGFGRTPFFSPDGYDSIRPGINWEQNFIHGNFVPNALLAPMDARTTAGPTGEDDYTYYHSGGVSWAIPWVSGLYALAVQVEPTMTPEYFERLALETAQTVSFTINDEIYSLSSVVDPTALISALEEGR